MIVVLLAGCGSDTPAEATAKVSVSGTDRLVFEPAEFTIPAGQQVTLELTAGEAVDHDFVVVGAANVGLVGEGVGRSYEGQAVASGDLAVVHAETGKAAAGTFMISEPGIYQVYCSVPGHREAGMVATLTIVDAA